MKAIIQIQQKSSPNSDLELFTDNLLSLKICGKDILSYYLDLLNELEVDEIFIFSEDIKELISSFYLSEVFSPKLTFINHCTSNDYYEENKDKFIEDELIIIENIGFIFNSFTRIKDEIKELKENFIVRDDSFSISYIKDHTKALCTLEKFSFLDIKTIGTLEDYIFTIDTILDNIDEIDYDLGYSKIDGIVIGKNVKIDKGTKLIAPIIIQDNVNILSNCTIGPNSIISNNVFIEDNTTVSNTIIIDDTYIGTNLAFENKILIEDEIIDKNTLIKHKIDNKLISSNK